MTTKSSRKVKPFTKRTRKITRLTPRRREAERLVDFIDAHGGKLGAFRAYRASTSPPPTTPPPERA